MDQYKNNDGTYTSPKNGKVYKTLKAFTAHWHYAGTTSPTAFADRLVSINCKFCDKSILQCSIKKHETACYLNPTNQIECKVCNSPIKDYKHSKGTCSRSCANKFFRSGPNNGNWKAESYRSLCFVEHAKKCVVCGEDKIVAVHHMNEDHSDNSIDNLVPLCPTHHQYMHSRYRSEILPKVEEYIRQFNLRFA